MYLQIKCLLLLFCLIHSSIYRQGRVRRILKLDPEIKTISKEASVAITKATELFVAYLTVRSQTINMRRKGKTIRDVDLYQIIHASELLQFMRIDFPKSVVTSAQEKSAQQHAATVANKAAEIPAGVQSIKSFFSLNNVPSTTADVATTANQGEDDAGENEEVEMAH